MAIESIGDWNARMLARLYPQFRAEVTWQQWAALLARQFADAEGAILSVQTVWSIDDSEGVQLDRIGRLVGQLRATAPDDATYRLYLRARIRANISDGTAADIYAVFRAMFGGAVAQRYEPGYPAGFTLHIYTAMTATTAAIAQQFLRAARTAPVYAVLVWSPAVVASMFYTARATFLDGAHLAGVTSIAVTSTAGFPATGSLRLDAGTADDEVVTYAVADATHFAVSATANAHADRAACVLVGAGAVGLGFPRAAFLADPSLAGDVSLTVNSTASWPASGTLRIDAGTATDETLAYTVADATHLTVAACAFDHDERAACYDPTTGGQLAGALTT